jgi:DNA-binding response OmpR family regulator
MLDFDEHLVSAVTRALQQEGVDVVAVSSVERAQAEALRQHFDVALLDCDLLDSAELSAFSELPVILTTSFLEPEGQHRFFSRGRLMRKPFTSAQLLSVLRATCAIKSFEDAGLMDVLRRANSAAQTLSLSVGRARIFIEAGELVHAELDGESGERALAEILAQGPHPEVKVIANSAERRSILRPFQALMLDLLRHIEEREQRESERAAEPRASTRTFRKGPSS